MILGLWSVKETQRFNDDLREIFGKITLFPPYRQELLEATYFALERDPNHTGTPVMNTKIRIVKWTPPMLDGYINIFFTVVDRQVQILGAAFREYEPPIS